MSRRDPVILPCPLCEGWGCLPPDKYQFHSAWTGCYSGLRRNRAEAFFQPFFPTPEEASTFVSATQRVPSRLVSCRYMRDQTVRLVGIADVLCKIRVGGDVLLLLLLTVAETVAKLWRAFGS